MNEVKKSWLVKAQARARACGNRMQVVNGSAVNVDTCRVRDPRRARLSLLFIHFVSYKLLFFHHFNSSFFCWYVYICY